MNQNKLDQLLSLFAEGKISRDEFEQLFDCLRSENDEDHFHYSMDHELRKMKTCSSMSKEEKDNIFENILNNERINQNTDPGRFVVLNIRAWYQIGVAASLLAILSIGLYFYSNRALDVQKELSKSAASEEKVIIKPGGDKAVLTLSDGSKIIFEDAKNLLILVDKKITVI